RCMKGYKQVVQAKTGPGSGLTIYLPQRYNPYLPGSTDALYQLLDFPMERGWSNLLEKVNSHQGWDRATASRIALQRIDFAPHFGGLFGVDRHNVKEIIQGIAPDKKVRHWVDLPRRGIFSDIKGRVQEILERLDDDRGSRKVRIFI